ncbi:T9SS type A sorting domain-containing protein, partial [bacterium]|nr:T9SS type A sorting domain-containing protein [bacterium]
ALTEQDVAVIFSVDMSAETVVMPLIICGDTSPLTWTWSTDNPDTLNDEGVNGDVTMGDDTWSITITFPTGTRKRVEYKYGNDGTDNDLPYGTNRLFYIDDVTHSLADPQVLPTDTFGMLTGVEEHGQPEDALPSEFVLLANYPNPFNPETSIGYRLNVAQPSAVSLTIYNLLGQQVRTLSEGVQAAGEYQMIWDGRDDAGRALTSGIYFVRLQVGETGQTRKLVLTK